VSKGELDLVFAAPTGLPAHRSNVLRYGLYRALRRAGLRRVDMHSLRHSFASALIVAGAPVTEVQHLLGHSSPQTTLKVYSHWFANTQSDSVDRLSRTLAGNLGHFLDTLEHSRGSAEVGERAQNI
jgi:integrase